jgi:hypothetical protein
MVELFEYAMYMDGFNLNLFHNLDKYEIEEANREHHCGTLACLAGHTPALWPDKFEWGFEQKNFQQLGWQNTATVIATKSGRMGCDIILDIMEATDKEHKDKILSVLPGYILEDMDSMDIKIPLSAIFSSNSVLTEEGNEEEDHTVVAEYRLEAIKEATSYQQLIEFIYDDYCHHSTWFK